MVSSVDLRSYNYPDQCLPASFVFTSFHWIYIFYSTHELLYLVVRFMACSEIFCSVSWLG